MLNDHKLQQYFCGLIYTILQVEKVPIIRIYLYLTKDLTAQDMIQAKLESVYNANNVLFTNCIEESDLIVTDSLNFDKKLKKEFFYFNMNLKTDYWFRLLQKINQIILKKEALQRKDLDVFSNKPQ